MEKVGSSGIRWLGVRHVVTKGGKSKDAAESGKREAMFSVQRKSMSNL